jgi:diguanylate cyclase (GGDEF)-like protein/PAS domain S-box-containing protein
MTRHVRAPAEKTPALTDRQRLERDLAACEDRFRAIVENMSDIVTVLDAGGLFLFASPSVETTLGFKPAELLGRSAGEFVVAEDLSAMREAFARIQETGIGPGSELRFPHKDGSVRILQSASRVGTWGGAKAYIVNSRDVTRQKELQDAVLHMALHDPLTGLPNRRLLYERLDRDLAMARRTGLPMALLSLDLDGVKQVNDRHGHAAGDALLQEVARRLMKTLRETDTVARVGGDEFVIVLPETPMVEAQQVATRLVGAVEKRVTISGAELTPRISYGIAVYDASASVDEVMSAADDAMYQSKSSRRATGQPTR